MDIKVEQLRWMDTIVEFLKGSIPQNRADARKLGHEAARYVLRDGKIYKWGLSLPLLKCLDSDESHYVMREVNEEVCGNHYGGRSRATKIIRQGYY